jgi:hypothetical protein
MRRAATDRRKASQDAFLHPDLSSRTNGWTT